MKFTIVEIAGLFAVALGAAAIVGAAAMVDARLGVALGGFFLCFAGVVAIYAATALEQQAAAKTTPPSARSAP